MTKADYKHFYCDYFYHDAIVSNISSEHLPNECQSISDCVYCCTI